MLVIGCCCWELPKGKQQAFYSTKLILLLCWRNLVLSNHKPRCTPKREGGNINPGMVSNCFSRLWRSSTGRWPARKMKKENLLMHVGGWMKTLSMLQQNWSLHFHSCNAVWGQGQNNFYFRTKIHCVQPSVGVDQAFVTPKCQPLFLPRENTGAESVHLVQ